MPNDARIAKLLGQLREAVAQRVAGLNRSLEVEEKAVAARVGQRKQFAWELRLPERLLTIYEEVKYYPDWARKNPADVSPSVTDVDVTDDSIRKVTVQFSLKGARYSFGFEGDQFYAPGDEMHYASLTLSGVDGAPLFRSRMSRYEIAKYRISEIDAFVPGDWVLDFMELSEAIAAIGIERDRRHRLSEVKGLERGFGLVMSDSDLNRLQARVGSRSAGSDLSSGGRFPGRWLRRLFARCHHGKEAT